MSGGKFWSLLAPQPLNQGLTVCRSHWRDEGRCDVATAQPPTEIRQARRGRPETDRKRDNASDDKRACARRGAVQHAALERCASAGLYCFPNTAQRTAPTDGRGARAGSLRLWGSAGPCGAPPPWPRRVRAPRGWASGRRLSQRSPDLAAPGLGQLRGHAAVVHTWRELSSVFGRRPDPLYRVPPDHRDEHARPRPLLTTRVDVGDGLTCQAAAFQALVINVTGE